MSTEALFFLIHRLSKDQIDVFRGWVRKRPKYRKNKLKYMQLFNVLLKCEFPDDPKVRQSPFDDATLFYRSRELLLRKIVTCFAEERNPILSELNLLQTATHFGAFDLAKEYFKMELGKRENQEPPIFLFHLAKLREETLEDYNIDLGEGIQLNSSDSFLDRINIEHRARKYVIEARKLLRSEEHLRMAHEESIRDFLVLLKGEHFSYWNLKLQTAAALLKYDFTEAALLQMEMADLLLDGSIAASSVKKIREISNAITLALRERNQPAAMRYIFSLSQMTPQNELESQLKKERWTRRSIEAAFTFGNTELAKEGLDEMNQHVKLFPEQTVALYHYVACLVFFTQGELREGHQLLRTALSLPKSIRLHLLWQFEVLDCLFHLEKGNHEFLFEMLDAKRKRYRQSPYVAFVLKGIDLILRNFGAIDIDLAVRIEEMEKSLPQIQEVTEGRFFFDFTKYISVKAEGGHFSKALVEEFSQKMFSMAI